MHCRFQRRIQLCILRLCFNVFSSAIRYISSTGNHCSRKHNVCCTSISSAWSSCCLNLAFTRRAIIPLFFASLVIYRSFYWHAEPFYLNYFLILTGTFCAYIAILFFDFGKIDLSVQNLSISHWRSLILLGL